jgi:hypothetical protein
MKSVRYVGMVLTCGMEGSFSFRLIWNLVKIYLCQVSALSSCKVAITYTSIASTIIVWMRIVSINAHVHFVFGLLPSVFIPLSHHRKLTYTWLSVLSLIVVVELLLLVGNSLLPSTHQTLAIDCCENPACKPRWR